MTKPLRIGLFTSAWDTVAWELVAEVHRNVVNGFIPNAEIAFVLCTRERGETTSGDAMLQNVQAVGLPIAVFPSLKFKTKARLKGREAKKKGDSSVLDVWREEHDAALLALLPSSDLDVLLGYMWQCSPLMCQCRTMINLHPALPRGPIGTYKEVIWQLIEEQATETGVMMHLVTKEVDRGPAIAYCRFPLRGPPFDLFWHEMEGRLKQESLEVIAEKDGENNALFSLIRRQGVIRELPMVVWTTRSMVERKIRIHDGDVVDSDGQILRSGYDLTKDIDATVRDNVAKENT